MRVHVVAPEGFDDPSRPSGGNVYDRRVFAGLAETGWDVRISTVSGRWPLGNDAARSRLADIVDAIPDGESVLIDGLVASASADQLLRHADRLRLHVLLHMPLVAAGDRTYDEATLRSERAVLAAATGVLVTSEWSRRQVLARHALHPDRVQVARPGADPAGAAAVDRAATVNGAGQLLCVAALAHHKGQDLLVEALAQLPDHADPRWTCVLGGPLDHDVAFVSRLRARIAQLGLDDRIRLPGVLDTASLDGAYAAADLLVVPSRSETYGMVVTEALARGVPVFAADVGGLPEALGRSADGSRPGRLVPAGDPGALATALDEWLRDPGYRERLAAAALDRRNSLTSWAHTVNQLAAALRPTGGG